MLDVEPQHEQAGSESEATWAVNEEPYGTPDSHPGTPVSSTDHHEDAGTPPSSQRRHHPMEDADWTPGDRALRSALQASIQQRMATPPNDHATAQCQEAQQCQHSAGEAQGHLEGQTPQEGQAQREREAIALPPGRRLNLTAARRALCEVRLDNPSCWCYLNATLTGLLWMLMSNPPLEATVEEVWGCQAHTWHAVLRQMDSPSLVALFALPELNQLMQLWDASPHTQCCAAEFLLRVLEWCQLPLLDHAWEQRFQADDSIEVWEKGGPLSLLTFNWVEELDSPQLALQDCVDSWHYNLGMRAGYLAPSCYKCLHLDRGWLCHEGAAILPRVNMTATVHLPIFLNDTLQVRLEEYMTVALLSILAL